MEEKRLELKNNLDVIALSFLMAALFAFKIFLFLRPSLSTIKQNKTKRVVGLYSLCKMLFHVYLLFLEINIVYQE